MNYLYSYFDSYPPLAIAFFAFIILLSVSRTFIRIFTSWNYHKIDGYVILFSLIGYGVWLVFFQDAELRFICRKETRRCDYYHSTVFNKGLRIADSYSLDGTTHAGIKKYERSCGRRCTKTVYRVTFKGEYPFFELPKDFPSKDDARDQAKKVADFLHTDIPEYVYTETFDHTGEIQAYVLLITGSMGMLALFLLLAKIRRK